MLCRYLAYAESGGSDLGPVALDKPILNPFERDVEEQLRSAGVPLVAQYGCSGYWIDYAAQHPVRPGQMVLAIECDGASYHSSSTARDRDRLRQEHLERLGWTFHRIWSQDWFYHREREVQRALAAYQAAVVSGDSAASDEAESGEVVPVVNPRTTAGSPGWVRRSGCPIAIRAGGIAAYSHAELVIAVRWIESDTLLRTEEELVAEAMAALGFSRKGSQIVAAITAAIADARSRAQSGTGSQAKGAIPNSEPR